MELYKITLKGKLLLAQPPPLWKKSRVRFRFERTQNRSIQYRVRNAKRQNVACVSFRTFSGRFFFLFAAKIRYVKSRGLWCNSRMDFLSHRIKIVKRAIVFSVYDRSILRYKTIVTVAHGWKKKQRRAQNRRRLRPKQIILTSQRVS